MTDLNFELIRIVIALAGTAYVAWEDLHTSFMDERVLYLMAGAGLVLNLLVWEWNFLLSSVGLAAVILVGGYAFYKAGQLGFGDVWLFTALQLLLPFSPVLLVGAFSGAIGSVVPNFPSTVLLASALGGRIYPFLVSIAAASALFALWGSALLYAWKLREKRLKPDAGILVGMLLALGILLYFMNGNLHASTGLNALLVLLFVPGVFLTSFKRQLMDEIVIQRIPISKVEDEDILAVEKMSARLVKKYNLGRVLTESEVAKLRKIQRIEGIRRFPVCKVLPRFGPYILLGLLASLLVGDVFAFALLL